MQSPMLSMSVHQHWHDHFASSVGATIGLLRAADWTRPVGILCTLPNADDGASFSWLRQSDTPAAAALVPDVRRLPEVVIDVAVVCAFCGDTMIAYGRKLRWKGNRKGADRGRGAPCG